MISFKQGLIIHPVESHHPAVSETGDHMTEKDNSKDMEHTRQIVRSEENTSARKSSLAFDELRKTVARLRAADGCPWDRAQTHESLKPACVEEAAEVVCGINILRETGKPDSLVEELGDLLLQVIMHAQIGEEEGLFSLTDVIDCVNEKMIRRHPHVFGEKSLEAIRRLREKLDNQPAAQPEVLPAAQSEVPPAAQGHRLPVQSCIKDDEGKEDACGNHSEVQDCLFPTISGTKDNEDEVKADWKYIKSLEKQGREWEEPFLFEAFDEAEKLIGVARERKKKKS